MADSARLTHVSPGIYTKETELQYAAKSLGLTTLGVVGETLKGPAFEPVAIENWRDFQNVFGGTSPEKFKGSKYPKYELPYIAKSYLSESNQMYVCRVLGLSGYNAGPAWVVKDVNGTVIAVLRSRGRYYKYYKRWTTSGSGDKCYNVNYDTLVYDCGEMEPDTDSNVTNFNAGAVTLEGYVSMSSDADVCSTREASWSGEEGGFTVSPRQYGRFTIVCNTGVYSSGSTEYSGETKKYPVSLNPADKDYILNVLGTTQENGDSPLFVEALYDVAWQDSVDGGSVSGISSDLAFYEPHYKNEYTEIEPVIDILDDNDTQNEASLTRGKVGYRYLAASGDIDVHEMVSGTPVSVKSVVGGIYVVAQHTDENNKRHYYYVDTKERLQNYSGATGETKQQVVLVGVDGRYHRNYGGAIKPVTCDMNDYKEQYRYASTPWIVSNLMGDKNNVELAKMFRFHTISDGNTSNYEVKVSIANIRPKEGEFDVQVRLLDDMDSTPMIVESFTKCSMKVGASNFIGYKIGTFDGAYESKSKYITVELSETASAAMGVPCGFLGYPLTQFGGVPVAGDANTDVHMPDIAYNVYFDEEVKPKKQYFGLSNISGVDIDMFTYKGVAAYGDEPEYLSRGFHLDSRLDKSASGVSVVTVDGVIGYTFESVKAANVTMSKNMSPIIGDDYAMEDTIYSDVKLRKFTVYFYGGFDGWDVYRDARTTGNDYKNTQYKGGVNKKNGLGYSFDSVTNPEAIGLDKPAITTDYYAYLAGARQFANPESIDINVFATPGIDLINNNMLSDEIIEMIEEERADSIYVATLPDKPYGAEDFVDEMYTPDEVVSLLEDTEIDSNYTCTYYPWVKYEDTANSQYVFLSPTKDVVRNMALTDNTTQPWFAPAGTTRGAVNCVKAKYVTKLADEDTLYEGRINPVKTFAVDGVKIWGQKNLQTTEGQLNRIAIRRLLLRLRKLISIACIGLIFDPNDPSTKNKFLSSVTPILDNIRENRGISDYRIEVDDSVEARQRRELPARLYVKAYNALEYISLDFILTPEQVSFENI